MSTSRPPLPIDPDLAARALRGALAAGGEFADLFCERSVKTTYRLEENRVKPIAVEVAPGTSDPAGLLAGIRRGLYVARMGGGAGDLSGAGFTFAVDEGWLIEDGCLTRPVRGATLTGTGWDVLMGVEAVGRDFALDPGGGRRGKMQLVPVSTGLPSLRVRGMVVGGTEARAPS